MRVVVRAWMLAVAVAAGGSGDARAQGTERDWKGKLKEDLDGFKPLLDGACGGKTTIAWTGGKLGGNPRQPEKPGWNALSTMCTAALEAAQWACRESEAVKKKLAKVTRVECKRGKGALAFSLKGATLGLGVDPSHAAATPPEQTSALKAKMLKELGG